MSRPKTALVFVALAACASACSDVQTPFSEPSSAGSDTSSAGATSSGAGGLAAGGKPASDGQAGAKNDGGNPQGGSAPGGSGGDELGGSGAASGGPQGGAPQGGETQGGAAQGGMGGSTGFHPCPSDGSACKILPLGDSITWGIQYDGAYRVELFSKAVANGHAITFTGSLSNGPTQVAGHAFPRNNEGHSGWTIDQVAGLVPSPALATPPNIVLLMIGTNDVYAASGQATMPDRLGKLLDKLIAAAPNALLVVAKITPLANAGSKATIQTYNQRIADLVQSRANAGEHVLLADMNTGFAAAMLSSDGVHPQKSGYDFMGDAWYAAIGNYLP